MADTPKLLPWHQKTWQHLQQSHDRLPHATLLCGGRGIGKMQFATHLAMSLLCEKAELEACGTCLNCQLFQSTTHPDFHVISSEAMLPRMHSSLAPFAERFLEDAKDRVKRKTVRSLIVIEQIRNLIEQAHSSAHISKNKVFMLVPAEAMNINAANSLLKVLEEPANDNFLILISDNAQQLLPTIASRCQKMRLPDPTDQQCREWLSSNGLKENEIEMILAAGTPPLDAVQKAKRNSLSAANEFIDEVTRSAIGESNRNALELADLGIKLGEMECLLALHRFLHSVMMAGFEPERDSDKQHKRLVYLSRSIDTKHLFSIYDHIGRLRHEIKDGSLNKQLVIEEVLLNLENLHTRSGQSL